MHDARDKTLSAIEASPQVARRLDIYVDLLDRWRKVTNLISEATFSHVWTRHIADSAQLMAYAPIARRWVDLGSGAGFPGMVIAIQLADVCGAHVHCIESDRRKCAFLREVARATKAPACIHTKQIELLDPSSLLPVDAVTSRALGPLPCLLEFANIWIERGAIGVFPRGRSVLSLARPHLNRHEFQLQIFPSKLDASAQIVRVRSSRKATK